MSSQPPRFVPTLTEVVQSLPLPLSVADTDSASAVDRSRAENQLVQRVLQRVDLMLEKRLREAVGQLIFEHTERLVPQIRQEIESVVRQSVIQAFAQELESDNKPSGT
jgi:tRNA A37 N6-isopentenylltransferase MiaA